MPEPGRLGARIGRRVVGALDKRKQGKLGRHPPAVDLVDDVIEVLARTGRHSLHGIRVGGVIDRPLVDQRGIQVRDGIATANALPDVKRRNREVDRARRILRNEARPVLPLLQAGTAGERQHQCQKKYPEKNLHSVQRKLFFHSRSAAKTSTGVSSLRWAH